MGKRNESRRDEQGRWDIGGGALEYGERVEDCLKREVLEEYGAKVESTEFLGFRDVHRMNNKKPTHWIALDFKVLVDPKQIRNNEPHKVDEVAWFRLDSIPQEKNLHSQLPTFLTKYRGKI